MRLGRYWQGTWPWGHECGVGLRLSGTPRDVAELRRFLLEMSCNPVAAERIIKALQTEGVKLTTVQASLNIGHIGDELGRLGITMEVIEPVEADRVNNTMIDHAAMLLALGRPMPDWVNEDEAKEALRRASEIEPLDPLALGPYSNVL